MNVTSSVAPSYKRVAGRIVFGAAMLVSLTAGTTLGLATVSAVEASAAELTGKDRACSVVVAHSAKAAEKIGCVTTAPWQSAEADTQLVASMSRYVGTLDEATMLDVAHQATYDVLAGSTVDQAAATADTRLDTAVGGDFTQSLRLVHYAVAVYLTDYVITDDGHVVPAA